MSFNGTSAAARRPVGVLKNGDMNASRSAAVALLAQDYWPIILYPPGLIVDKDRGPEEGKRPIGKGWGLKQATLEDINIKTKSHPGANIGIALGPGRAPRGKWLVDFEGDGSQAEDSFLRLSQGEDPVTPSHGSTRGTHRFLVGDQRLLELLIGAGAVEGKGMSAGVYHLAGFPDLEIRIGGPKADGTIKQIQSVVPPSASMTKAGEMAPPREWIHDSDTPLADTPEGVYRTLEQIAANRAAVAETPPAPPKNGDPYELTFNGSSVENYGRRALAIAVERIETASDGDRNNALNRETYSIAQLVGAGALDLPSVVANVSEAARRNGLSDAEVRSTVQSAVESGIKNPRDLSHVGKKDGRSKKAKTSGTLRLVSGDQPAELRDEADNYRESGNVIHWISPDGDVPLANFTARILETVVRHEGIKEVTRFTLRITHRDGGIPRSFVVAAQDYPSMKWVYELGGGYAVDSGRDAKDRLRHAIQVLSHRDGISRVEEHTSLGWIKHDDAWIYLNAGGAIGKDGASPVVRVDIGTPLDVYKLPSPQVPPEHAKQAILACLDIRRLASNGRANSRRITALVATIPFRAVLEPSNFGAHFAGPSGSRKTSLGRLIQQHHSTETRGTSAPTAAGWGDSVNALQRLLFDCRHAPLIVDDLKTEDQVSGAEKVFQNQGNLQARARMNVDQTLQKPLSPRGMIVSTGETDPRTRSTQGRILLAEIGKDDIDLKVLSSLQASGDSGLFAQAMACYLRWLAPRLDKIRSDFRESASKLLAEIGEFPGAHPRHPDIVSQLLAAYRPFLQFAIESGAIDRRGAGEIFDSMRQMLIELGQAQADHQEQCQPGKKFLDLIASSLLAGHCHLQDARSDNAPRECAKACGWRKDWLYQGSDEGQVLDWKIPANSKCIGFIDEADQWLYLDRNEAKEVATGASRRSGDSSQNFASIGRELMHEGLVKIHEEKVGDRRVPRADGNKRIKSLGVRRYLWIRVTDLFGDVPVPTVPTLTSEEMEFGNNDDRYATPY